MKTLKTVFFFFIMPLLLSSCNSPNPQSKTLEFPQTTWNMNTEDVLQAYDITKDTAQVYTVAGRGTAFAVDNCNVFGEKADSVIFAFMDLKKDSSGNFPEYTEKLPDSDEVLCTVQVIYPADINVDRLLKNMEKEYGKTVPELTLYPLYQSVASGSLMTVQKYKESDDVKLWTGESINTLIPERESENYKDLWIPYRPNLTKKNWKEFSQNAGAVTIILQKSENSVTLYFDAYNLAVYYELKNQLGQLN